MGERVVAGWESKRERWEKRESESQTDQSLISSFLPKAITCPQTVTPNSILDPLKDNYIFKDYVKVTCMEGYEVEMVSCPSSPAMGSYNPFPSDVLRTLLTSMYLSQAL